MNPRHAYKRGHIFREAFERPEDIVACLDLLMTRQRIGRCKNSAQLRALAKKLRGVAAEAVDEVQVLSKRTMHGLGGAGELEHPLNFSSAVRHILIQDTIVVAYDTHKAIVDDLFPLDIALGSWLLFVCHSVQNSLDALLQEGILARGSIGCGTLFDSPELILGSSFIDAYDHVEGESRKPIIGVQVSPALLKYQNWINDSLNNIHCSVGEFLHNHVYVAHAGSVFLDPGIHDRDTLEMMLGLVRTSGCSDTFLFATADLYISSLRAWSGETDFYNASLWEHAKYRDRSHLSAEWYQQWFEQWRRENTRRRIGLAKPTTDTEMPEPQSGNWELPVKALQPKSRVASDQKAPRRSRAARG